MKHLILALQFLTRLPLPSVKADAQDFAKCMPWFPVAGLMVGIAVAVPYWLLHAHDPWLGALAGLIGWIAITGALHLDGLGDVADGTGAVHSQNHDARARLSAVMADPHVGSFAVVVIVLQLLAKLILLHALNLTQSNSLGILATLLLIPAFARIAPIAWTLFLPPLHTGLGSQFRVGVRKWHLTVWCIIMLGAGLLLSPTLLVPLLAMPLWGWWLRSRLGGISGDGHGAGIELLETAMLATWVLIS